MEAESGEGCLAVVGVILSGAKDLGRNRLLVSDVLLAELESKAFSTEILRCAQDDTAWRFRLRSFVPISALRALCGISLTLNCAQDDTERKMTKDGRNPKVTSSATDASNAA